jgi:hypothetical protein
MFEKRPKLSFFILGMLFGALFGGIIVYYNSVITNENKISVNLIPQIVKQVIGVINNKSENTIDTLKSNIIKNPNYPINDSSLALKQNIETSNYDNQGIAAQEDTVSIDSISNSNFSESITIKKEELLVAKELTIYPLEIMVNTKQNKSDSLLSVVSGTKDETKKGNQQKIMVELWKSPINYKGYQASKNKIILFGFAEIQEIKLYNNKNNLFLKHNENAYYIDFSSDFNSYEKVLDPILLSQINKLNP